MEGYTYYVYESLEAIQMAEKYIDMYRPMSAYEMFLENNQELTRNNQAANNSQGAIMKAINAIKEMINRLIEKVTTFFQTMFMGKGEKDQFLRFKEAIKTNPEFAGKKVTVRDFREINNRYQRALQEIDKGIAIAQNDKNERAGDIADSICQKAMAIAKGTSSTAKAMFSVDTALRLAEGNREVAKKINAMLKEEGYAMKYIESQLGNDRAQDFKKKIKSSSKLLSLHRAKVMILGQYHSSMSGSLNQVIDDFQQLLNPKMDAKTNFNRLKQGRLVDDALGSFNKKAGTNIRKRDVMSVAASAGKEIHSIRRQTKRFERAVKRKTEREKKRAEREQRMADAGIKTQKQRQKENLRNFIGS